MMPIQDLLHRIRWDAEFGDAEFEIGYYDRIADRILRVPLSSLQFDATASDSFYLPGSDAESAGIPLHRIKQVFRDGALIWHREH
jgi:uncharacterized protein (UPF0248 family)